MNVVMAFGWVGIMLCLGMVLRAKVPLFRNMLMPASMIAGVVGLVLMNIGIIQSVSSGMYTEIVNQLFTISFISIGLTSIPKSNESTSMTAKKVLRGSIGMGMTWNILYALTPVIGAIVIFLIGKVFYMDPVYGLLIPFSFAQGPGQAVVFGSIFEQYGWQDAAMVGLTFAAIGFLMAFLVGVPIARAGLRKKLAKNSGEIDDAMMRGYNKPEDSQGSMGNETTHSGNVDTMAFHFAIIGVCYILAVGLAKLFALIPGIIGSSMSSMLFMNGMFAAYAVKYVMKKFDIEYLLDNKFQTKITGWSTDFVVISAFMAIELTVVGKWMVPILIASAVVTVITTLICIYFGQRYGDENDFERTLGLLGTGLGTVPTGIALVKIVDPSLRTATAVELGMMNIPMMLSMVTVMILLAMAAGSLSISIGLLLLLIPIPIYLVIMKMSGVFGKRTYLFVGRSVGHSVQDYMTGVAITDESMED